MSDIRNLSARIKGVHGMWSEWAVCFGSLTLCVVLSYIIPKMLLPGVVLIIAWRVAAYSNNPKRRDYRRCVNISQATVRALILTAFIMVAALVYNRVMIYHGSADEFYNPEIPYITSLILFPSTTLFAAIDTLKGPGPHPCHSCRLIMGISQENDTLSALFIPYARGQKKLMLWLSASLSVIDWGYYFALYKNDAFNSSDKYFFLAVPVIIYILSLFYLGSQYKGLEIRLREACVRLGSATGKCTRLRFLVIHDDRLLVSARQSDSNHILMCLDTPAITVIPFTENVSDETARDKFTEYSRSDCFTLKPLYSNMTSDNISNVFHYAAILGCENDDTIPEKLRTEGNDWMSIGDIDRAMKSGILSADLSAEIYRIFTITMAWKTYDREGLRKYPIKNYHPTFRLRDLKEWDVDYNDMHWMDVSALNQDKPFFKIKRMFRRLNGRSS